MAARSGTPDDFSAALGGSSEASDAISWARPRRRLTRTDDARGAYRGRRARRVDEEYVDDGPVGPPPERNWWIWLLLLLIVVAAGLLLWWLLTRGNDKTTVPRVVGMQETAATQTLQSKHLKVLPNTAASTQPVGVVFAQRPGAGVQVKKGQTVAISISGGPAQKAVPNVADLPLKQAQSRLKAAGFKSSVKRVASSRPKGVVTDQTPAAGVTAVSGTTVELSVSNGQKPVVVPSVVGITQGAAVTALTKIGLKPQLRNVPSAKPVGQVVAQKPPAGKEVDKGSTVLLNVSRGSGGPSTTTTVQQTTTAATTVTTTASAPIPSVRNLAVTAGLRRLNTAGFRPIVRYTNSTQTAGRIIAQAPASGTARRGSPVRITVSNGPNPAAAVSIPDVVGQDQAAAATALRQAGLRPVVLFRPTSDQTQVGNVIEEQPVAGQSIPRGSYVAIFIGRSP